MSKKIFTVLLLAVFVLAQFSMASAAAVAGADITLTNASEFLPRPRPPHTPPPPLTGVWARFPLVPPTMWTSMPAM